MNPTRQGFSDAAVLAWADLPHLGVLLDPVAFSALLDRRVELHRLRVKPGRSALVGWRSAETVDSGRAELADFGWAAILTDPDKIDNLLRRVRHAGTAVTIHRLDDRRLDQESTALVFSGLSVADPRLARDLAHVRRKLPAGARVRVLAYNPGRRLVLAVGPDGSAEQPSKVLRVGAHQQRQLLATARTWRDLGVPTLPMAPFGRRGTAVESPWWGDGDLAVRPDRDAARATGRAIARLHRTSAGASGTSGSFRVPAPPVTTALHELLPLSRGLITEIAETLRTRLAPVTPPVMVHGDLSPDQVLWAGDQVRIIDLERAGSGPPGLDVGSWLAACRLRNHPELAEAFLEGYGELATPPEDPAWQARALVASALEPFRRGRPGWRSAVRERLDLAAQVLGIRTASESS